MLRREVMKLGGLFGLGAGTPSRFPYPDRPQPAPAIGPSQGQSTRARTVVVFGPAGTVSGVFVYAPGTIPGPGNPPIAAMSASATDPFGNDITPGDASSLGTIIAIGATPVGGTSSYVQLVPGTPSAQILISSGDVAEGIAAHIDSFISGGGAARNLNLRLTSPRTTGTPAALTTMFLSSEAADGSQGPNWGVTATDGVTSGSLLLGTTGLQVSSGSLVSTSGTAANSSKIQTDTWHTAAVVNGWASSTLKYTLRADNCIQIVGLIDPAASISTTFFTLPVGYRPTTTQDFPLGFHTAAGAGGGIFGRVSTGTGVLSALNSGVGSGVIVVNVILSLDYA